MIRKCKVSTCSKNRSGRNIYCPSCWDKLPKDLRATVRQGTEKGTHTLRANPSKEWLIKALKYLQPDVRTRNQDQSVVSSVLVVA